MSEPSLFDESSPESLVARVTDEIRERQRRGERPDVEEYACRYPQAAGLLRNVLAALKVVGLSEGPADALSCEPEVPVPAAFGDFRLVRQVGRGGMGIVYEAEQLSLNRRVALKVLPFAATLDPRHLQRFRNEARAAASLHHPNIVPVYGVGCERAVHFYAMQFIDGTSLADLIDQLRRQQGSGPATVPQRAAADEPAKAAGTLLPADTLGTTSGFGERAYWRRVAELGIQTAEALEHAHSLGIVHRDVKPGNLLLDATGKLWVADFGLAKLGAEVGVTRSQEVLGTLRYMSPEQALAHHGLVDHRTDLYALGATLYELMTLRPAVEGNDRQELLRRIAFEDVLPPRKWNRRIPVDLETVVLKCLRKGPTERYATARELATDLQRWLDDEPVRARRPDLGERVWKWARRNRAVAASLACSLALLLILSAVSALVYARKANEERQARELAQQRLEQISKANDLLAGIFEDLSPRMELEHGPTLREQLKRRVLRAVEQLEGEATGDPLTVARLQHTLGGALLDLGEPTQALELLSRAFQTRTAQLGPNHLDTLQSMLTLAWVYRHAGQSDRALPLFEQALDRTKEQLGPDHPLTLHSLTGLAAVCLDTGQLNRAILLHEQALAGERRTLGPDHDLTLHCMNHLALAYKEAGHLEKALPLLEETLAKRKEVCGPDHPDTLTSMDNLGLAYQEAGHLEKALPLQEQALAKRKEKLGPDHPETLTSMNNLGLAYKEAGHLEKALPLLEQTLARRKEKLCPDHPRTLTSMDNLAMAYRAAGQLDRAIPLSEQALAKRKEKLGADHPRTLTSMNNLGLAYQEAGQLDRAIPLYEQALALTTQKLGPDHPDTLTLMNNLAPAYARAGRLDKALPLYEQTLAKRKEKLGADHPRTLTSMNNLAVALEKGGQLEKALPLYEQVLTRLTQKLGPDHPQTLSSMNGLANAYLTAGQLDRSTPLFEDLLPRVRQRLGADHPQTLSALANAWANYRQSGRLDRAIALLEEALQGSRKLSGGRSRQFQEWARPRLGVTYEQAGQAQKAETIFREQLRQARQMHGDVSPGTAAALAQLGHNLLLQKKYPEAETPLRECLTMRQKNMPGHWLTLGTQSMLAAALLGQKKYTAAEPLLLAGYQGLKQQQTKIPADGKVYLIEALQRLVQLDEATGNTQRAAQWRRALEQARKTAKQAGASP